MFCPSSVVWLWMRVLILPLDVFYVALITPFQTNKSKKHWLLNSFPLYGGFSPCVILILPSRSLPDTLLYSTAKSFPMTSEQRTPYTHPQPPLLPFLFRPLLPSWALFFLVQIRWLVVPQDMRSSISCHA